MDVSICVATCRRPQGLARLLASLGRMKRPPGLSVEIVVVDNDPEGGTPSAAAPAPDLPLRWLSEPRRNIAHARNRAVEQAWGRWLAFVDDDEVVHEDWLLAYAEMAEAHEADGFFGPVLPRLECERTGWLDLESFYARERYATGSVLSGPGARTGNGFVRRVLFRDAAFDPAFGRSGGEDAELFGRMLARGARLLWCDEARVHEFVPPERHRLGWLTRRWFRGGCTWARLEGRRRGHPARVATALLCAIRATVLAAATPIALLAGRRAAARTGLRACGQAGRAYGLLGGDYEEYAG